MSQTVGLAGRKYGRGRVVATSKALANENFLPKNTDFFIRFFMNACLWATRNSGANRVISIISTGSTDLDQTLLTLFQQTTYFSPQIDTSWYSDTQFISNADLYILSPSYSAFDGVKMPDHKQLHLINNVEYSGAGLFLGEWFHLLQSIPSKRSFSLSSNDNQGLYKLSPFNISKDYLIYTDADEILFTQEVFNDSTSSSIPKSFVLDNNIIDMPFRGHIVQIGSVTNDSVIYWSTDIPTDDVTTTTTTTTTTIKPYEDIMLKVFDLNLINACGPQKLYLDGENSDKFKLEGNSLYLTKLIEEEQELMVNVVAEDYFENERYNRVVEQLVINFVDCSSPISKPKNGEGPAYSFRINGDLVKKVWGNVTPTGVIQPFDDWSFSGKGNAESPTFVCLGGTHSDVNTIWMQVNNGGEISANIYADLEDSFNTSNILDRAQLFLIQNSGEYQTHPYQHTGDMTDFDKDQPHIVKPYVVSSNEAYNFFRENGFYNFQFNVENPNSVDENGNPLIDDIYLVLYLKKDMIRSENSDRICANFFFGTTTTPPPEEFDFVVFIVNEVPNTSVSFNGNIVSAIQYSSIATEFPENNFKTISINAAGNFILNNDITANEDSEYISANIRSSTSTGKLIDITLLEMPEGGGSTILTITGSVGTTTTTTPPPEYDVIVSVVSDLIEGAYLDDYVLTTYGPANSLRYVRFIWRTEEGYEYRPDTSPTGNGPGSIDPPYTFYDRPTITEIIFETKPNMTRLPTPTPASYNASYNNEISVGKGIWWSSGSNINIVGYIYVPVIIPALGGEIKLRLGTNQHPHDEPDLTTTTTTTQPPVPCDNSVYVICQQTLDCQNTPNNTCEPTANSYQTLVLSSCCDLSESEMLDVVRSYNQSSSSATLNDMYGLRCHPSDFEPLALCLPKDLEGNCQETIHNQILEVIPCGFQMPNNPLP